MKPCYLLSFIRSFMSLPSFHRVANCVMQRNDSQCQLKCIWRLFTPPRTTFTNITGNEHPISLFIAADTVSGSINIRLPPIQLHLLHLLGKIHNSLQDAQKDTMKPTSPLPFHPFFMYQSSFHRVSNYVMQRNGAKPKREVHLKIRSEFIVMQWVRSLSQITTKSLGSLFHFPWDIEGICRQGLNGDSKIHINVYYGSIRGKTSN